jgi:UDP-glucose 4-epimerase
VRAIVTGGAGFIGSHVAGALLARGDEVHVLDDLSSGSREKVPDGAELHVGDIRADAAATFERVRPDACFHLAAQADVNTSVARPDFDADVNVVGTVRVLEAARACGAKVVFSSTGGAIYGECDGPAPETQERLPISPYGISKLAGEEYLAGWNRLFGAGHVSLRFANVYGARQEPTLEGGVIAIFLDRLAAGEPTRIFGDGRQTRDFVYVADVVDAWLRVAGDESTRGAVYNVGSGRETSIAALAEAVLGVWRTSREGYDVRAEPAQLGDVRRSVADISALRAATGWAPGTSLQEGVRRTVGWAAESR